MLVPKRIEVTHTGENGEPDLFAVFEMRDGRPECIEWRVTCKPTGRGMRGADLTLLNVDVMTADVFARHALVHDGTTGDGGDSWSPPRNDVEVAAAGRAMYEARKVRRGGVTRAELERVAQVYRENIDDAPTRAVAVALGYTDVTAARRVQRARQEGLLPPTTPGKRRA